MRSGSIVGRMCQYITSLQDLLVWLVRCSSRPALVLLRSLLCWCGWVLSEGDFWSSASTDALVDAPVPRGPRRARRLDRAFVRSLTTGLAEAAWSRTPGRIASAIGRFRKARLPIVQVGSIVASEARHLYQYRERSREALCPSAEPIISFVCDGTRMGKKEVLFSAACGVKSGLAVWCPPQVACHRGISPDGPRTSRPKVVFWGRRKTPQNAAKRRKTPQGARTRGQLCSEKRAFVM